MAHCRFSEKSQVVALRHGYQCRAFSKLLASTYWVAGLRMPTPCGCKAHRRTRRMPQDLYRPRPGVPGCVLLVPLGEPQRQVVMARGAAVQPEGEQDWWAGKRCDGLPCGVGAWVRLLQQLRVMVVLVGGGAWLRWHSSRLARAIRV